MFKRGKRKRRKIPLTPGIIALLSQLNY